MQKSHCLNKKKIVDSKLKKQKKKKKKRPMAQRVRRRLTE